MIATSPNYWAAKEKGHSSTQIIFFWYPNFWAILPIEYAYPKWSLPARYPKKSRHFWLYILFPAEPISIFGGIHPIYLGVSKNRGKPQNGWFIMEKPYFLMDDLGGKPTNFRKHPFWFKFSVGEVVVGYHATTPGLRCPTHQKIWCPVGGEDRDFDVLSQGVTTPRCRAGRIRKTGDMMN